jgi:glycine/D-amino acid oxidase-like deaminating enzyme
MVKEVSSRVWVITAMGSRGLLYHAYFGEKLAQAIQGMITLSFQELMHYLK